MIEKLKVVLLAIIAVVLVLDFLGYPKKKKSIEMVTTTKITDMSVNHTDIVTSFEHDGQTYVVVQK